MYVLRGIDDALWTRVSTRIGPDHDDVTYRTLMVTLLRTRRTRRTCRRLAWQ